MALLTAKLLLHLLETADLAIQLSTVAIAALLRLIDELLADGANKVFIQVVNGRRNKPYDIKARLERCWRILENLHYNI